MGSKSFGSEVDTTDRVARPTENKIDDLREDVERAVVALEARTGLPVIHGLSSTVDDPGGTVGVDLNAAAVLTIYGEGFDGQGRATLIHEVAAGDYVGNVNTSSKISALEAGADGNKVSVALIDPNANNAALGVVLVADAITVNLATGGGGAISSTVADVKAAIEADASVDKLIHWDEGGNGAGLITALAKTYLAGGAGPSEFTMTAGSKICLQKGSVYADDPPTDTHLVTTTASNIGGAAGDIAVLNMVVGGQSVPPVTLGTKA